ncbi:MAG: FAD-binding protein, partial [Reyranella sp.]|nr:FAD-binding protein [Reyranella sp.]
MGTSTSLVAHPSRRGPSGPLLRVRSRSGEERGVDDFQVDVLVVGAGNAAACAALAARETGASVARLEAAPEAERGGNSTYTAGAMRVVFHG